MSSRYRSASASLRHCCSAPRLARQTPLDACRLEQVQHDVQDALWNAVDLRQLSPLPLALGTRGHELCQGLAADADGASTGHRLPSQCAQDSSVPGLFATAQA
jgi:hypothetical protein